MTFQEAQARFAAIVSGITLATPSGVLTQKATELQTLLTSLPNTPEFDPIGNAIAEFSPKLIGIMTITVLTSLQTRDAGLKDVSTLLTQASNKANADARTLTFEKPKLVLAALTESVTKLKEIQSAAKSSNFHEAASKADAVVTLIEHVRASIKAT